MAALGTSDGHGADASGTSAGHGADASGTSAARGARAPPAAGAGTSSASCGPELRREWHLRRPWRERERSRQRARARAEALSRGPPTAARARAGDHAGAGAVGGQATQVWCCCGPWLRLWGSEPLLASMLYPPAADDMNADRTKYVASSLPIYFPTCTAAAVLAVLVSCSLS